MRRFSYWSIGVVTCVMLVLTVAFLDPEPARAQRPPEAGGQNLDARLTAVEEGLAAETVARIAAAAEEANNRAAADSDLAARLATVELGLVTEEVARAAGDAAVLDLLTGVTNALCQESQRLAGNPSSEAIALCGDRLFKTVFVTSTKSLPNFLTLGGGATSLAGADNICNARAQEAGLPGTYTAWLSDRATNARDRVTQATVPYVNTVGDTVADNFADLVNCGPSCLRAPIGFDESGNPPSAGFPFAAAAWTGTDTFGRISFNQAGVPKDCLNWTLDVSSSARFGDANSVSPSWTEGSTLTCNVFLAHYCFQD